MKDKYASLRNVLPKEERLKVLAKETKGAAILPNAGTVFYIDLTRDELEGDVDIFLAAGDVRRIFEATFDQLPEKDENRKKWRAAFITRLFRYPRIKIIIKPVLNKISLEETDRYKV